MLFDFFNGVPESRSVSIFGWSIWGQHDFRIDHFFLASVVLGFLVILGKQLFSGLVGSSGNRRVAFASLSDFDIEVGYWQFV